MMYRIDLEGEELLLIGKALEVLPYNKVVMLINKIQEQITEQDRRAADDKKQEG